jgi:hypothetical protein
MKMYSWILLGGALLVLGFAAGAAPAAPGGFDDHFFIAQAPPPPAGGSFEGGPERRGGPGWMEETPELVTLVRDIAVLRQINQADLSSKQISAILPVLKNLAKQQSQMVGQVKKNLLAERARLLKAQGDSNSKPRVSLGQSAQNYRGKVEAARGKISKLLSAPQAKIINDLIAPPHFALGETGPAGPERRDAKKTAPSPNREQLQELRQNRLGRGHPSVELSRLISLLVEKQKALAK